MSCWSRRYWRSATLEGTGSEAIEAFVAGFEAECYLRKPVTWSLYRAGWFTTTLFGTVGAAAVAVRLRSLSVDGTRAAVEIAAALAAGSLRHNDTTTKPIQADTRHAPV